jgi:hypothetical protein
MFSTVDPRLRYTKRKGGALLSGVSGKQKAIKREKTAALVSTLAGSR